jgi:hypothetical protein
MSVEIEGVEYDSYAEWLSETYGGDMQPEDQRFPVVVRCTTEYLVWVEGSSYGAKKGETPHELAARVVAEDGAAYELWDDEEPIGGYWSAAPAEDWQVEAYGPYTAVGVGPVTSDGSYLSARAFAEIDAEKVRQQAAYAHARSLRTVELPAEDVSA